MTMQNIKRPGGCSTHHAGPSSLDERPALVSIAPDALARETDPTSVYRYYDPVGLLIYVGVTKRGSQRNAEHNARAMWWHFVARQEIEHLPNRAAALHREAELIREFRPPFNTQHNGNSDTARSDYFTFAQSFNPSPRQVLSQFGRAVPLLPMDSAVPVYYTPPQFGAVTELMDIPRGTPVRAPGKWTVVLSVEDRGPTKVIRLGKPLPAGTMAFTHVYYTSQKPMAFAVKQIQAGPPAGVPTLVRTWIGGA